jgi:type IV fimbrial biogenesis protein FimT
MRTFIQNGRLNTQANDLIGDLNFARSEAIKRRSNVGICRSTDGVTFAGAGPLGDGRVVFVDANNNDDCDAGDPILRFREGLASGNSLAAASPNPIIFSANGRPIATAVGAFAVCDYRGASKGKQVSLNSIGQASVSAVAPGAC